MVGAIHDKGDASGDGTESADDELVARKFIVVGDVFLKPVRALRVIVVGVVSYLDIGAGDYIFDEADLGDSWGRKRLIRVWAVLHGQHHLSG